MGVSPLHIQMLMSMPVMSIQVNPSQTTVKVFELVSLGLQSLLLRTSAPRYFLAMHDKGKGKEKQDSLIIIFMIACVWVWFNIFLQFVCHLQLRLYKRCLHENRLTHGSELWSGPPWGDMNADISNGHDILPIYGSIAINFEKNIVGSTRKQHWLKSLIHAMNEGWDKCFMTIMGHGDHKLLKVMEVS